jgi:6-phosphogluconolactonase (cycloisomerase 2 family)
VTVDPSGKFAYVANDVSGNVSAFSIDASTGALMAVSGSPFPAGSGLQPVTVPFSVTVDPSGKFAYVANFSSGDVSAFSIDASTGALTAVSGSPFPAGSGPISISVDPSGKFAYVANHNSSKVSAFSIDATTGALTAVGSSVTVAPGSGPESITVDPSGKFAYVANYGDGINPGMVSAFGIDATTGALHTVTGSPFTAGTGPDSVIITGTIQ